MDGRYNDLIDHIVTGVLTLALVIAGTVIYVYTGGTPEWIVGGVSAVLAFYFRGRVNGQFNASKMSELETLRREMKNVAAILNDQASTEAMAAGSSLKDANAAQPGVGSDPAAPNP